MAVALLGKCVALLGFLVVLLYATCYGFRIRDATAPQTHSAVPCVPAHGRPCPADGQTVTTATATGVPTRKWHELRIVAGGGRKPPAEPTSETEKIRRSTEHPKDKSTTGPAPTRPGKRSVQVEDDEDEETLVVVEDEETVEETERDQLDEIEEEDEEDEEETSDIEISDRDVKHKKEKVKKFVRDEDESKDDDDDENDEDDDDDDDEDDDDDDDDDDDKDSKKVPKTSLKKEEKKKQIEETQAKVKKVVKYSKSKVTEVEKDDDDDEDKEDEKKTTAKTVQQKVTESKKQVHKKPDKSQILKSDEDDEDDEKDEEDDETKKATPEPRKLEKVRLADKDKAKVSLKQEDKKPADITKPAAESVKKTIQSTKKREPIESTKQPAESKKKLDEAQKPIESANKLSEGARKVESVKATSKPKAEVSKTATKTDEKSKTRVKPETSSTPAPKTKEQAKQPEKADAKKVKPTSKPSKEVSQAGKQETKPKTRKRRDASITLSELNDAILRVPTFVPNFTNVENSECQQHGKIFLRQLRGYKLWALQMLDSSAKIPSGLLRGNVNQLGDYDQCLGVLAHVKVDEKTIRIQGKYCLASVDLHASHSDTKLPVNLMQARAFIRGNMHDPSHFIPKFTTINWALCVPAACTAEDAERTLESALEDYNRTLGIRFAVNVDPNMCYVKQKSQTYSKETIGVLYFYAMIVCLVIVATVRDYLVETQRKGNYSERIIMSFSLRRTINALLKGVTGAADITCIHGIRALATIVLYVAHQLITISRIPLSNRTSLTEIANSPASSVLRVSLVYTDTFLLLSGVLTAYNMTHELTCRGEIRWFCRFIARFIRLSPALLAVVFWYAFVMEHIGSGPQWNSVITANADLCKDNAWTNLLYVQNFFPFEEMCATHTHQLALDMQLSLSAPVLVFFLQYKPLIGILLMVFLLLLSATLRYIATTSNYLSLVIFHGISLKRLYKTANLTYALPLHRATPYVSGVGLGVLLHHTGKNVRIHKALVILGWLIATALGSWSLFSPWRQARRDYVYDAEEAAHYAVISPVLWAAALCWSIFACFTEHGGAVNRFLSSHWLVIFSRISYAVYLTQFAVFFYNVGTTRYSSEFHVHRAIDPLEVAMVIAASVVLTLLFDLPMQEVKSVIMESTDVALVREASDEKKTSANEDRNAAKVTAGERTNDVFEDDEVASTGWDWQKNITHGAAVIEGHETEEEVVGVPTLKKANGRRMLFIGHETRDLSEEASGRVTPRNLARDAERVKRISSQRYTTDDSEEEAVEYLRSQRERELEAPSRNRRSLSRTKDGKRPSPKESESEEDRQRRRESDDDARQFGRPESRTRTTARDADDYRSWEFVGKEASSVRERQDSKQFLARSADVARGTFSSESEEDSSVRGRSKPERVPSSDARTSDEEEWERELRIRRKQFIEKVVPQQSDSLTEEKSEANEETLKRRSSAEGRIALLKDELSGEDSMDSWTVSVGPRIALLGSSQEPSEPEEDGVYMRRREYREQGPPSREESQSEEESSQETSRRPSYTSTSQRTSMEEEEDVNNYNFVLTKDSKRESLQDLSKLSQEELVNAGWNVVKKEGELLLKPTGLFKRESIIKSQASEEDPEYLLPERPKLVQQEREHPFKKAWQVQKSRSEEEGSSAYAIKESKDSKEQQSEAKPREQQPNKRELGGEQSSEDVESLADDEVGATVVLRGKSTDTEDNRTSSKSDETDSLSTEYSRATQEESHRSKSETDEDSGRFNWPGEAKKEEDGEEIYGQEKVGNRGRSEEADWDWEQEET